MVLRIARELSYQLFRKAAPRPVVTVLLGG